mmetsp:Transcript_23698/g.71184  ORF Transcript_23698/g.71184 Transcript_23698/m.71184 type:complete len:205 (-) Transcript_23698:286-900(-)
MRQRVCRRAGLAHQLGRFPRRLALRLGRLWRRGLHRVAVHRAPGRDRHRRRWRFHFQFSGRLRRGEHFVERHKDDPCVVGGEPRALEAQPSRHPPGLREPRGHAVPAVVVMRARKGGGVQVGESIRGECMASGACRERRPFFACDTAQDGPNISQLRRRRDIGCGRRPLLTPRTWLGAPPLSLRLLLRRPEGPSSAGALLRDRR